VDAHLAAERAGLHLEPVALVLTIEHAVLFVAEAFAEQALQRAGQLAERRRGLDGAVNFGAALLGAEHLPRAEVQLVQEKPAIVLVVEEDLVPEQLGAAVVNVLDASLFHVTRPNTRAEPDFAIGQEMWKRIPPGRFSN
jgi:hypothetical protein